MHIPFCILINFGFFLANLSNVNDLKEYLLDIDSYELLRDLPPMGCSIGIDEKGPCYFLWSPVIEGIGGFYIFRLTIFRHNTSFVFLQILMLMNRFSQQAL